MRIIHHALRAIIISTVVIVGVFAFSASVEAVAACTHYASPTGTGTGLSQSSPFKISSFWSVTSPGKTLCLLDGTYIGSDSMIDPPDGMSGTASAPITVRAINDGKVRIDGQGANRPIYLRGNNYFVVEGMNAHASSESVVNIVGSRNDIIRRVVAWNAKDPGNHMVFLVSDSSQYGESSQTLLEDVAGFGAARKTFSLANNTTVRRAWGSWDASHNLGPKMTYTLAYNFYHVLVENSIGTWTGSMMKQTYQLNCPTPGESLKCGQTMNNYSVDQPYAIFGMDRLDGDPNANTKLLGSIAYVKGSDHFHPGQAILAYNNTFQHSNNVAYIEPGSYTDRNTFSLVNGSADCCSTASNLTGIGGKGATIEGEWATSNIEHSASPSGVSSIYTGSTGATVCKRYVNGVLTNEPLWPWPMNQRIKDAMVQAGRTPVDVTATIEGMFGPIPAECRWEGGGGDPPPPSPPVNSIAINAGGGAFTAADGTAYLADQYFSGGSTHSTGDPIANTSDDGLYQNERFGSFSYNLPLQNGSYTVTLKFAEIYHPAAGLRQFDVAIEDQSILSNLDLYAQAGHDTAYDRTFTTTVSDNTLTIAFTTDIDNAKVSAIKVIPPETPTLSGDINKDGTVNSLDWSMMNVKWGTNDTAADLNGDGIANSLDFSILNQNWGRTP